MKVLIVDDAPVVLKLLELALTMEDYEVEKASNAIEAMEKVKKTQFDFGIFDVNMPGKTGIELTKDVLASPNGKDIQIIILTTESSEEMQEQGRNAGASGWLIKPFDNDELIGLLKELGE